MSAATALQPLHPLAPAPTLLSSIVGLRRFTVAEYRKMLDAGILVENERVELVEGYVVEKGVRNQPHENALRRLTNRFPRRLPDGYILQSQGAIRLSDGEPEPDGAVLRGDETTCDHRFPGPDDLAMVIEVADSSLLRDRRDKGRSYARAGIAVYWIINLVDGRIEVYTNPEPTAMSPVYRDRTDYAPGDAVPLVLDGAVVGSVPASDLLP